MSSSAQDKRQSREKRHQSIRKRIAGTPERPRVAVFRSAKHIYAQVVDDLNRRTLLAVSDVEKEIRDAALAQEGERKKTDRAKLVGATLAKRCLERGIEKIVFDRAGYKYHGRIEALASGAREAGLKF